MGSDNLQNKNDENENYKMKEAVFVDYRDNNCHQNI